MGIRTCRHSLQNYFIIEGWHTPREVAGYEEKLRQRKDGGIIYSFDVYLQEQRSPPVYTKTRMDDGRI